MRWPRVIRHASFWSGITLFVVVGLFSYRSIAILTESNQSVDHTQTVLVAIGELGSLLATSETAQRGYLITNDPIYLQLYEDARARVPEAVTRIRTLSRDNENQERRMDALQGPLDERLGLLAKHIEERQRLGIAGLDSGEFARGKVLMDAINGRLADMRAEEQRLYKIRAGTAATQAHLAGAVGAAGTMAGVVVLGVAFGWMSRDVRSRQRAEATLNTLNQQLEERVRERTALLETEIAERRHIDEMLSAIIEEAPFGIIGVAPDRNVVIWNKGAERIFGYTAGDTVGRPSPLVPPEAKLEYDQLYQRAVSGERLRDVAVRLRRKDGALVDIVFSCAPLHGAGGELRGMVFMFEDVTARKALEQQLRQAQKMEAVGQLTGGIAHDFNNLLGIIVGSLDLLRDLVRKDPEPAELVEEALGGALRGAELTKRMLAFARRQPLKPQKVKLNDTLPDMIEMLRRTLGEDIVITTSLADDLWTALADPSQVEDAVLNLALNARDAMPQGGRLVIETANAKFDDVYAAQHSEVAAGDYVMLAVTDSGIGMPADIVERVFEPFFTTKETGQGTGLGLSMVYGFIKQSNGHVKIYSEPGHGTTVKLYLPKATEGDALPLADAGDLVEQPVGNETILIVEDNAKLRLVAVKLLRGLGYRVREADGAKTALAILAEFDDIDLLFTDIVMPDGTGYELAVKARERRPQLKILFTSGYSKHFVQNGNATELGARTIAKPYRKQELAEKLRRIFGEADDAGSVRGIDAS